MMLLEPAATRGGVKHYKMFFVFFSCSMLVNIIYSLQHQCNISFVNSFIAIFSNLFWGSLGIYLNLITTQDSLWLTGTDTTSLWEILNFNLIEI